MIRTEGLTKRFGEIAAVRELDFSVPAGSVLGLLGPNGAGKTTLLRLLVGIVRPSSGRLWVLGRDCSVDAPAIRRRTAFVPQSKAIHPGVRVAEFVRWYASFFREFDFAGARKLLERWDVRPAGKANALSHGAAASVLLAVALARPAELLLLDEPSEGLDPSAAEDLWRTVMRRSGAPEGAGVVLATHRLDDVERVCDRVAIMVRGRLVLDGEIDDLRSRWRRLILRGPASMRVADSIPGLVEVRNRLGIIEVTTSDWHPSLPGRIDPDTEIVDVREMTIREIYLATVARHG